MPRTKPNTKIIQIMGVPDEVHAEIRRLAFEANVSMNKWLNTALIYSVGEGDAITYKLRIATGSTKSGLTAGKE